MIGHYVFIHDLPWRVVEKNDFIDVLEMLSDDLNFRNISPDALYQLARYFEEFWTSGVPVPRDNGLYAGDGRELEILWVRYSPERLCLKLRAGPLLDETPG